MHRTLMSSCLCLSCVQFSSLANKQMSGSLGTIRTFVKSFHKSVLLDDENEVGCMHEDGRNDKKKSCDEELI